MARYRITEERVEGNERIITEYVRSFAYRDCPTAGCSFPCDKDGNVDTESLFPEGLENYNNCINGTYDVIDEGVQTREERIRLCSCGSGEEPERIYDGHGIYLTSACDKCRKTKMRGYRSDIMDYYEADEPIEPDY